LVDRHDENGKIGNDIGYGVSDEQRTKIKACPFISWIPGPRDGVALEDADEEED
jgi:hypothetical protein